MRVLAGPVQHVVLDVFAAPALKLDARVGVRPQDLMVSVVSVVANDAADWSFRMGRAQFLTGEL